MSKYNARKVTVNGITFDSQKEAQRWWELSMLQRGKAIHDLKRQVKYELIPAQYDESGKLLERAVTYIADFVYIDNKSGKKIVEDAKGVKTPEYIIKRKLMLYEHGIRIVEV